jgi:hypothetical protein
MNLGLEKEAARLDAMRAGLGERVVRYVGTGDAAAVLADIAAVDRVNGAFYLNVNLEPGWGAIFTLTGQLPPEVMLRYARCLAAARNRRPPGAVAYPEWLDPFLQLAARRAEGYPDGPLPEDATLTADYVARMLAADGRAPGALVDFAFNIAHDDPQRFDRVRFIAALPGFGELAARHRDATAPAFASKEYLQRSNALGLLARVPAESLHVFAPEIVACALDSSKFVRERAAPAIARGGRERRRAAAGGRRAREGRATHPCRAAAGGGRRARRCLVAKREAVAGRKAATALRDGSLRTRAARDRGHAAAGAPAPPRSTPRSPPSTTA